MSYCRGFTIRLLRATTVGTAQTAKQHWITISRILGCGMTLAGLALAQPAQALLSATARDQNAGSVICSGTDGGTGTLDVNCINPNANFAFINVTAVGIPSPDLVTTQLSVTSGNLATRDTLEIDVARTGISFPGGTLSVNLTLGGMTGGAGPVTLTALGQGGAVIFTHDFTTVGGVTSAAIPVGSLTDNGAKFILTFSGPNQTINALISITGSAQTASAGPGSVIVFPKFVGGAPGVTGSLAPVTVDGITGISRTEIEIGAVCPAGATCTPHQPVTVQFHWVCPGTEGVNSNICRESSFQVVISVDGKLAFSADGTPINTNSPRVPAPLCPRGYLIGWVVNNNTLQPIKFDALVGNGVIRGPDLATGPRAGTSTAVSAYPAISIEANSVDPVGTPLNVPLAFNGASGGYSEITGVQIADVKFDRMVSAPPPTVPQPNVLSFTTLNFLTLDVVSGRPNNPTFVPLLFFNESDAAPSTTNPLFENPTDGTVEFVCWTQLTLSTDIDASLTQVFQGTRKGLVIAGPAAKMADGNAPDDVDGPVTLLGLVETVEGTIPNNFQERKYNYVPSNNGEPVPTTFVP